MMIIGRHVLWDNSHTDSVIMSLLLSYLTIMDPKHLREWCRLRGPVDALAASSSSLDDYPDLDVLLQGDVSGECSSTQKHLYEEGLSSEVGAEEGPSTGDGSVVQDSDY